MGFDKIDSPSGAPYPQKSKLDQAVGALPGQLAEGLLNFGKGVLNPDAFPEYHRGMGTEKDSWAGRTGGRLRTAAEIPVDMANAMAGGGMKSSPTVIAKLNQLAKLAKAGNIDAKAELAAHFGPMFSRIGQRTRPVIGDEARGLEPRASGKDIAQQFHVTLNNAINHWNPLESDNFEAYVLSQRKKAPSIATRMESTVRKPGLDKMQKEILRLQDEYHTRYGMPATAADEVKRDGFIARRIQGDWTQIADQMPEAEARRTMLKQAVDMVRQARSQMAQMQTTTLDADPRAKIQGVHRQIPEGLTIQQGMEETPNNVAAAQKAILIKAQQKMDPIDARIMELAQEIDPTTKRPISTEEVARRLTAEGHKMSGRRVRQRMDRAKKTAQDVEKGQGFEGKLPEPEGPSGGPIGGGSDAQDPWGSKPTRTRPLTPRETETNPRAMGTNPRALQGRDLTPEELAAKHKLTYQGQWDLGGGKKGPYEFRMENEGPAKGANVTVSNLADLKAALKAKYESFGQGFQKLGE